MSNNGTLKISITGTGSNMPERVMSNADLEKIVDTSDEWILSRTGISERRICADDESTSDIGAKAALKAIEDAGIDVEAIDIIICGTCTPDMNFPSSACLIQNIIGAKNAFCLDVNAACSGFLYGMETARHMLAGGAYKIALVVGAEKTSSLIDWTDRTTCILFGDGAGAAVLQAVEEGGIIDTRLRSDGTLNELLYVPGGGSRIPSTPDSIANKMNSIRMEGPEVFKHAVTKMAKTASNLLKKAGLTADDVALVVPHQANIRILTAVAKMLDLGEDKLFINAHKYGNTSAASVIVALDEAARGGLIKKGDIVLLVVFGAGFTWGATLIEWSK